MKSVRMILAFAVSAIFVAACNGTKDKRAGGPEFITGAEEVEDTTIYGRCGEGTAMHTLELVTDKGDTLVLAVDTEDGEDVVRGGLLAGDRLAVTAFRNADGEDVASRVLNLTTLLGTWTSIDRRFELQEGGAVVSNVTDRIRIPNGAYTTADWLFRQILSTSIHWVPTRSALKTARAFMPIGVW